MTRRDAYGLYYRVEGGEILRAYPLAGDASRPAAFSGTGVTPATLHQITDDGRRELFAELLAV